MVSVSVLKNFPSIRSFIKKFQFLQKYNTSKTKIIPVVVYLWLAQNLYRLSSI